MSGRSAYVRKKITETKAKGRPRKASADFHEDYSYLDPAGHSAPVSLGGGAPAEFAPPHSFDPVGPIGTGSTTNARPGRLPPGAASPVPGESGFGGAAITPTPTLSSEDDFSHRRRATLTSTDDGPGIEKSGLRTLIDRRSDNVRKGLAKTLGFMRKDKSDGDADESAMSNAFANPIYSRDNHSRESYGRDDYGYSLPRRPVHPVLQVPAAPPTATGSSPTLPSPWESVSSLVTSPSTAVTTPSSRMVSPLSPNPAPAPPALVRRWIGSGVPVQRWNKLRKDPELWDPNGDVLVFLCQREQRSRAQPSFRLSSHIIEATGSRPLITLLREGSTEDATELALSKGQHQQRVQQHQHQQHQPQQQNYRTGQPTPPISEDAASSVGDVDGQISYEMFFPAPPTISVTDQLRYHLATRNVFALLYHSSLVGLTLYQALADLQSRLEACMPAAGADVVADMVSYLCSRGLDDVRADPGTAVGLLAWAEGATVRWEEGWAECFVHCAGMYPVLEPQCPDFRATTAVTRALLERAHLETRMRVHAAEERLAEFRYDDMWPAAGPAAASGPAAAARMQRFLVAHYARAHGGRWPPPPQPPSLTNSGGGGGGDPDPDQPWLTRIVVQALQRDFGALYDYLVDRDIVWDESEFRSGRKWVMVSSAAADRGRASFDADLHELPLTDILIEFDNRQRFPHIPHPYPLVPESIAPPATAREGGLFRGPSGGRKGSSAGVGAGDGNLERRVHLAYMDATNIYLLGSDFVQSDLLDAFIKFEKTDLTAEVNPAIARKGRWVLLYGILQTLASLSADAPGLRYKDGVPYHMCPRLAGAKLPPWRTVSAGMDKKADRGSGEASHEDSHCWVAPRLWKEAEKGAAAVKVAAVANTLAANQEGGGRGSDEYPLTRSTTGRAETRASSGSVKSNGTGAGLRQQPSSPQLSYDPLPQPLPHPPTHIHLVVPSPSIPSQGDGDGEGEAEAEAEAEAEGEAVEARFGVVRQGSIIDLSNRRNHHGHSGHHHHHSPKRMQSLDSISSSSVSRGGGASSARGGGAPLTSTEVDHMMQLRRELGLVAGSRSKSGSVSEGSRGGGDSVASSHQGSLRAKTSGGRGGGGDGAGWGGAVNAAAAAAPAAVTPPPPTYADYGDVDNVRNVAEEADVVVDADIDQDGLMDELDQVSDMDDDDREYAIRTPRGVSPLSM